MAQGVIHLNFVNRADNAEDLKISIFQKPVPFGDEDVAVAWRVFDHSVRGAHYSFELPFVLPDIELDRPGTGKQPWLPLPEGAQYEILADANEYFGEINELPDNGEPAGGVEIDTTIFRSVEEVDLPEPKIWIDVAPETAGGQIIDSAHWARINAEISLKGIVSADIVMTGGGDGPNSTPFQFQLENIQHG